jgi:cysteine-rich repeat protein
MRKIGLFGGGLSGALMSTTLALAFGCSSADSGRNASADADSAALAFRGKGRHVPVPSKFHPGHHGWPIRDPGGHGHGLGGRNGGPGQPSAGQSSTGTAGSGPTAGGAQSGGGSFSGGSGGVGGYVTDTVCGNGVLGWDERCDDGNDVAGDGCDKGCNIETGHVCAQSGLPCRKAACGDGHQDVIYSQVANPSMSAGGGSWAVTYAEQCDDGNSVPGDGCDEHCAVEGIFICSEPGEPCRYPTCGDGQQDVVYPRWSGDGAGGGGGGSSEPLYQETCDDGNTVPGDGCDKGCSVEPGFMCPYPGEPCRQPRCGDGYVDFIPDPTMMGGGVSGGGAGGAASSGSFEVCDDGNNTSGDGCSATCQVETGWYCFDPGLPCKETRCGDGVIGYVHHTATGGGGGAGGGGNFEYYSQEPCDDGNTVNGDGCDSTCDLESGWVCPEPGGTCHRAVCGDGIVEWPVEDCDSGSNPSNDGCHNCKYDWSGGGAGGVMGNPGAGSPGTAGATMSSSGAGGRN